MVREKLSIDAALARAIGEYGMPLAISDVDLLLGRYGSDRMSSQSASPFS
jgi:hypothetical protein